MKKYIQIVAYGYESITHIFSKLEGYLCNYSDLIYKLSNDKITITINDDDIVAVEFINRIKDIMKRYNIFDFEIKISSEQGKIQKQNVLCKSENILPLTQNREITLFHHHVLLRQIPINESLEPWWNSNFINIYYRTGVFCFFDYTDFNSYYEPLFMKTNYMYYESEKFNNKDFFISELSKNKYLYLWVDNYYIKTAYCYKQKHDIHPVLIYGYSLDKNVYYCSCFEIKRGLFTSECTIEDMHMALESARLFGSPEFKHPPVSFLMPKVFEEKYNFGGERFLDELYNYINGKGKLDNVYFTFEHPVEHNTNNDSFGLNVTRVLIKHLFESRSKIFDYRIFHMVVENKFIILKSLKYFYKGSESKISNIILNYENLAEEYKKVRNFYIKESYLENKGQGFYPPPKRKEVINELCERLTELVAEEYNLLVLLFPLLERFLLFNKSDNKKANMSKIAEVENGNDEKGHYYLLKWNSSISTDKIQIYNRYGLFNGKIVFDNGFSIDVYGHEAESHLLDIRFEAINTNEIKYYPENHINSYMPIISVYHTNLLHKSTMLCSSIFSERNDLSFLPQNVIDNDDEKYWCPEVSDKNRYIQFDFKDVVEFNTTIIKQHYITNRILSYRVDYTADGSCWSTAARHTGFIYDKDNILKFERVGGTSIRLIIEECEPDVSGYDVPNITKFEVQNCI